MWATITKPFAWLLLKFYEWTGNYGVAVILFALVINLILLPFMAKSKKSMMRTSRLQPRIDVAIERERRLQPVLHRRIEGGEPLAVQLGQLVRQVHHLLEVRDLQLLGRDAQLGDVVDHLRRRHRGGAVRSREVERLGGGDDDQHGDSEMDSRIHDPLRVQA